jgi:hypothetical protein
MRVAQPRSSKWPSQPELEFGKSRNRRKLMSRNQLAATILLFVANPALAASTAPTKGVWWEQTVRTEMKGMPMAMPAQTMKVCVSETDQWSKPPDRQDNCTFTILSRGPSSVKWKSVCTGKEAMEGLGDFTWTKDASEGTITMHTQMGDMVMVQKGRRLGGECSPRAEEEKREGEYADMRARGVKAEAESKAAAARQAKAACEHGVENMTADLFVVRSGGLAACADGDARSRFCAKLQTRAGYDLAGVSPDRNRERGAEACKLDLGQLETRLCAEAVKTGDLTWLLRHCPADVKVIVKRECAGRDYTSTAEKFRDFCAHAAAESMKGDQDGKPERKTKKPKAPKEEDGEAKPADKTLEKGKSLLKGVLGF